MIRTTNIELTGNRYKADQLSLAHTNRLLEIFRNFNSFRKLPTNTHLENFFDDTGKFVGSIHISTNYGIEVVTVNVPFGKEKKVKKYRQEEKIVPCFIVTGGEGESRKVVGYIACMSGTFLEPYKWFNVIEDDEIILDSFYDEGDKYYDGEIALDARHLLSTSGDDSLLFFRQSGLSPDDDRQSEGPITEIGGLVQDCASFEFVTDADNWWAWSFAMATVLRSGGSGVSWDTQFDGSALFVDSSERATYGGTDYASVDERICPASEGPCLDDAEEWRDGFSLTDSCNYTDNDVNSFDRTEGVTLEAGEFLNGAARFSLRLNGTLADSVYTHFTTVQNTSLHTWVDRDTPVYPGFWGIIQDEGEPDDVEFGSDTTITFTRSAFITIDGAASNISGIFGWGDGRKYDGRGELDILYHKDDGASTPTVLTTLLSGPDEGSYVDMGLVYRGPGADGFQGSTQYPLQNVGGDYYIALPGVIGAPDSIDYQVRGHIFLGIVQTTTEVL